MCATGSTVPYYHAVVHGKYLDKGSKVFIRMLWRKLVSIFYLDQLRILESRTFMNELQWYFNETSIICFRNMPSAYCSHILWGLIWVLIHINTLRPRQNGRHFPDDKCILLNENVSVSIKISLKIFLNGFINNIPALVQIMVCAEEATSHYLNR